MDKYRIIEVKQHGKTWYELQKGRRQSDYRGDSWDVWESVKEWTTLYGHTPTVRKFNTVDEARAERERLRSAIRVERVVE